MSLQKTVFASATLLSMIYFVAGGYLSSNIKSDSTIVLPQLVGNRISKFANQGFTGKEASSGAEVVTMPDASQFDERDANPPPTNTEILPGVFRGDWGETPVYARNDRVNYQDAAYLSLENDNQNQAPASSQSHWRLLKSFKTADMQACQAPEQGGDLSKCDFSNTVSLKDRNLSGALLIKARLSGELGSADLTGANLSGAAVIGALVIGPDTRMEGANLSKLQSDGNNPLIAESAKLANANLTQANLYGARMSGADLTAAQLTAATLTGAELTQTHLENAELSKANLSYANLSAADLANASLPDADLSEANLTDSDFVNTDLQQANLAGAELSGSDFSGADLRGANLAAVKNAQRAIVDSRTNFMSAICPDGVTVDGTQVITCVGHGF